MSSSVSPADSRRGVWLTATAFVCWGLFPLYWKPLQAIPAWQILSHRIIWSAVFLAGILCVRMQWAWLGKVMQQPRKYAVFAWSSSLLTLNWLLYIWAVNSGHIVEASLGYFITPLFNVLLGRWFLAERLSRGQLAAVGLAAAGVLWLTLSTRAFPWIALSLAATFAWYGLLRKRAPLASLEGLALETFLMAPLALAALLWFEWQGQAAFGHGSGWQTMLLMGAGVVTAVPLLLFAAGARRLRMATVGLLQYIGPSIQLLLGVWLFQESFGSARAIGFALIWLALLLYSAEGWRQSRLRRRRE
ncbi:EamA family transporter RarD [Neisseriaceae bacterium TC5R-5]|nr:EamA family transporter RarD [Neisseriaceae bacterium TC5R-5]